MLYLLIAAGIFMVAVGLALVKEERDNSIS
jgi:hypothetical protein